MKPKLERFDGKRRVFWAIAVLILIYGGVLLVIALHSSYTVYMRSQAAPDSPRWGNSSLAPGTPREAFRLRPAPFAMSPAIAFAGAAISIAAGSALISLLRAKETKDARREVIDAMVTPDEKLVIRELEAHGGELTQSDIVGKTCLSKVKVHRILKRLESLGIVSKYPYGVTNKIRLEKSLYEE